MNRITPSSCNYLFISLLSSFATVQAPHRNGDVNLGGLLTIQSKGTSKNQCGELSVRRLDMALAMIFAIEKINNDSKLLPNITLGYDIRDYCESAQMAVQITYDLFKNTCLTNITENKMGKKSSIALIGPEDSSTAVVTAGLFQALNVSGISAGATSPELSSHFYKHLYRTVPSDTFRAKAMADIVEHFNWSYVAAVGNDNSYGRSGLWSLVKEAATRNNSFCVAMTEIIPNEGSVLSIRNIVTTLHRHQNIRVVILWLYGSYLNDFFREVNRQNLTGRVWVLSDITTFLLTKAFSTLDGPIVIVPHKFLNPGFEEHKKHLTIKTIQQYFPEWWGEIRTLLKKCSARKDKAICFSEFVHGMHSSYSPFVIDAVYSMAHALDILVQDTNTTDKGYNRKIKIDINVMQSLLSRVKFVGLTGNISFDKLGDRGSAFYDILTLQQVESASTNRLKEVVIGKWKENDQQDKRLYFFEKIHWNTPNGSPPKSECLDQCSAGTRKAITSPCCWQCVSCPDGTINPIPGSERCTECPKEKQSNEARTKCLDLPLANLTYSSAGGIVILVFSACGIISTLFSFTVTCRFWNTPIVKASNREFSLVLMVSILLLLTLVVINLFEPTDTICSIIYPWRYVAYTFCLSFLLAKILRISSAFQVPMAHSFVITSLTNRMQGVIVLTMHILLLFVLLPWLLLDPPIKKEHILTDQYIFIECKAYNLVVGRSLFLVTCSYILFQTIFSAFCSFKIRNIPENFSEAKRIAFSMYIFSFSVLAYHPVEFSMDGWYVTVVDCVTTLLSAYGFLCCIILPKIYIILLRPELNNLRHIRQEVTQFSFGTSSAVHVNPVFDGSIQHGQN
ncbi:extracellular calcium-sensing receptor-like [Oculina patagonica]